MDCTALESLARKARGWEEGLRTRLKWQARGGREGRKGEEGEGGAEGAEGVEWEESG